MCCTLRAVMNAAALSVTRQMQKRMYRRLRLSLDCASSSRRCLAAMAAVGLLAPLKALPARPRSAAVRVRCAAGPPAGGSKGGAKPKAGQPWKKARGGAPRPGFVEDTSTETGMPKSESERCAAAQRALWVQKSGARTRPDSRIALRRSVAPKYKAVQAEMRGDAPPAAPVRVAAAHAPSVSRSVTQKAFHCTACRLRLRWWTTTPSTRGWRR